MSTETPVTGHRPGTPVERVAAALDARLGAPVVVVGSLPAEARDLDLLVVPSDLGDVVRHLEGLGLHRQGGVWTGGPDSELAGAVVDLVDPDALRLSSAEVARLLEDSRPIPGLRSLRRPAPEAVLLLLAGRLGATGLLDPVRRSRITRALAEDPRAWELARRSAAAWSVSSSLTWLAAAYAGEGRASARTRLAAARERWCDEVPARRRMPVRRLIRAVVGRRPLPPVVALSGLDGSGKSTQVRLLVEGLQAAGYPSVAVWNRLGYSPALRTLTAPLRLLLRAVPLAMSRLAHEAELPYLHDEPDGEFAVPAEHRATRGLRGKLPWLNPPWITAVTLLNAVPLRRQVRRAVCRGQVVVVDRYEVDSRVHLVARYGEAHVRRQVRLLRLLLVEPLAAYYLDVPPEVAYERKPEEHRVEGLRLHRALYLRKVLDSRVRVLDGGLPAEKISALLLADVLRRLGAEPVAD